jgi:hypothetical protein
MGNTAAPATKFVIATVSRRAIGGEQSVDTAISRSACERKGRQGSRDEEDRLEAIRRAAAWLAIAAEAHSPNCERRRPT